MKVLIIGAGITGCFTAARLMHKGVDVSILARGARAARLLRRRSTWRWSASRPCTDRRSCISCEKYLDLDAVAADRALLKQTMRATAQGFTAIRRAGYPILPRSLNIMRWIPAALGAGKIRALLQSKFGRIALAAHAATARGEMYHFATDFLSLAGEDAGADLRELLTAI